MINFVGDNRYTDAKIGIASHAGEVMMSEKWGTLTDKDARGYDVIGIDELYCFSDFLVTEHWASLGIRVEATLINGSFERKPIEAFSICLLYTSPSPRDKRQSRMPSSA